MDTQLFITVEKKPRLFSLMLTFLGGVVVGFIGAFYYEVLSKPVLPTEPVLDLDEVGAHNLAQWAEESD